MTKIAVVSLLPNYYQDGIWVRLNQNDKLKSTVIYLSDRGLERTWDPDARIWRDWDFFIDLNQYSHMFLKNYGLDTLPTFLTRINPGLIKEINKHNYDVILVHGYSTFSAWLAVLMAKLTSRRLIFRGEAVLANNEMGWRSRFKKLILKQLFKLSDAVLYSCTGNRNFFEFYGVPDKKLISIPCAVNNDFFQREREKWSQYKYLTKVELGLSENSFVVLFIARFYYPKRAKDLVKAMRLIKERGYDNDKVCSVFVGDGPDMEQIKQMINEWQLDNIILVGFKDQKSIGKFLAIGDLGVVASQWDFSPKAMNEMMNFAMPIICTDTVGTAYDLVQEGVNGHIIQVGDVELLANHICTLANDREHSKQMGQRSLKIVSEWNFDRDVEGIEKAVEYVMSHYQCKEK